MNRIIGSIIVLLLCYSNCYCKPLPLVYVIGTGGTIAGQAISGVQQEYTPAAVGVAAIVKTVSEITKLARIKTVQAFNIDSCDMTVFHWLRLVKTINNVLKQKNVAGIVITHGTDTMEESAYFLNLVLKTTKPVVLVGSMRPASSLSPDGPLNLYNAIAVATDLYARGRGVLVVMNDRIFAGRSVTKTNTTNVDTFKSHNSGKIGSVLYGKVRFYAKTETLKTINSPFSVVGRKTLPKVVIIYEHVGSGNAQFKAAIKTHVAGIVFAGSGDGNINSSERKLLKLARSKGMVIVRSSRTGSGVVEYNSLYNLDSKLGLVAAGNLNPQKAAILLMLALTKTTNPKVIQGYFNRY